MVTRKNDEAVSPVIGVILMVAITVILAAVIAAFVFGMSGNISKTKVVAVTVQQPNASAISLTYQGGQDAPTLGSINWTINDVAKSPLTPTAPHTILEVGKTATDVGAADAYGGRDHVIVVGKVLGIGSISKKIEISALSFSSSALDKLKKSKIEASFVIDEIKSNPSAKNIKVL